MLDVGSRSDALSLQDYVQGKRRLFDLAMALQDHNCIQYQFSEKEYKELKQYTQ